MSDDVVVCSTCEGLLDPDARLVFNKEPCSCPGQLAAFPILPGETKGAYRDRLRPVLTLARNSLKGTRGRLRVLTKARIAALEACWPKALCRHCGHDVYGARWAHVGTGTSAGWTYVHTNGEAAPREASCPGAEPDNDAPMSASVPRGVAA